MPNPAATYPFKPGDVLLDVGRNRGHVFVFSRYCNKGTFYGIMVENRSGDSDKCGVGWQCQPNDVAVFKKIATYGGDIAWLENLDRSLWEGKCRCTKEEIGLIRSHILWAMSEVPILF